jgi:HEAT repeat protein
VREEARRAALLLLDPTQRDGRAVEPILLALSDVRFDASERAELVEVLGRTGSPRAVPILASFVPARDPALRIAAIVALGNTEGPEVDRTLSSLLVSEERAAQAAAMDSLATAGGKVAMAKLVATLGGDVELDRTRALDALGAMLERHPDEGTLRAMGAMLERAGGSERDALFEAMGRSRLASATAMLSGALTGATDADRRSVAIALTYAAQARPVLLKLLRAEDESVRANAAWALGAAGSAEDIHTLLALAREVSGVAPNAVASASALVQAHGLSARAGEWFCPLSSDLRGDVQNNALVALAHAKARCGNGEALRTTLVRASSARLRRAAARALQASLSSTEADDANRQALARCAATDRATEVAEACRGRGAASANREDAASRPGAATIASKENAATRAPPEHATIYVVGASASRAGASVSIAQPDGMVRWARTDRRGAVVEPRAGAGELKLVEPSWR